MCFNDNRIRRTILMISSKNNTIIATKKTVLRVDQHMLCTNTQYLIHASPTGLTVYRVFGL